jgi:hypothetical protein
MQLPVKGKAMVPAMMPMRRKIFKKKEKYTVLYKKAKQWRKKAVQMMTANKERKERCTKISDMDPKLFFFGFGTHFRTSEFWIRIWIRILSD